MEAIRIVRFADVSLAKMMVGISSMKELIKNISSVIPATMQNGKATRSAFVQGVADGLLWICFTLKSLFPDTHSVPAPPAERILWKDDER